MKAAFIGELGPPEVIQYDELPTPRTGTSDVLVKGSPQIRRNAVCERRRWECRNGSAAASKELGGKSSSHVDKRGKSEVV